MLGPYPVSLFGSTVGQFPCRNGRRLSRNDQMFHPKFQLDLLIRTISIEIVKVKGTIKLLHPFILGVLARWFSPSQGVFMAQVGPRRSISRSKLTLEKQHHVRPKFDMGPSPPQSLKHIRPELTHLVNWAGLTRISTTFGIFYHLFRTGWASHFCNLIHSDPI